MKIPKKFKLFHHTIIVIEKEKLNSHDAKWGQINFARKELLLDKNLEADFKEQTFLHELTHLIFDSLSEDELAKNEKLVNNFSELLYQAFETAEY
jgi:hypothetical protein